VLHGGALRLIEVLYEPGLTIGSGGHAPIVGVGSDIADSPRFCL
jgi:hypothetical protein